MVVKKSQMKAVAKYKKAHYDQIVVRVPKGQKEVLVKIARDRKLSLNALMVEAINKFIESDK